MKSGWKDQQGLTLVELIIAMAVAAAVIMGVIGAMDQVLQSRQNSERMSALRQVQNAGYWISWDGIQATNVTAEGSQGFPLTMIRVDSGNVTHQVVYSLEDMPPAASSGALKQMLRKEWLDGVASGTATVAQYLDPGSTSCLWDGSAAMLSCTITARVNEELETRTYQVQPRPFS